MQFAMTPMAMHMSQVKHIKMIATPGRSHYVWLNWYSSYTLQKIKPYIISVHVLLMDWLHVLKWLALMFVVFHQRQGHVGLLFQDTTTTQALNSVSISSTGAVKEMKITSKHLKSVRRDARQKVYTLGKYADSENCSMHVSCSWQKYYNTLEALCMLSCSLLCLQVVQQRCIVDYANIMTCP